MEAPEENNKGKQKYSKFIRYKKNRSRSWNI